MFIIDVKVSVRITDVKWLYTIIVQSSHRNINYIIKTITSQYMLLPVLITSNKDKLLYQKLVS
jgi:hypothetical protein